MKLVPFVFAFFFTFP
ncbi:MULTISPECIES: pheA operon leader peptide PheL [Enterobacteriaceae]|nr:MULTISPECIES: pheA operon leader peptide PheL [Enterobacteriaceae]QTL62285.1 pheA operon leader peptide PheL [Klebsiella pneumoniae]WFZ50768.1 pheA operon leader peptide PheL [Citrobacter braakii]HDZ1420398.1 pheA operon leader peptide PheL [Klebsiella pneumoniae]